MMEILAQNECYDLVDGEYVFTKTLVVYQSNGEKYHASYNSHMRPASDIQEDEFRESRRIPTAAYCPLFTSNLTRAPESLSESFYVKRPSLISYDRVDNELDQSPISRQVLQEVQIWETLRQHPHPNIAQYLGCLIHDNRIHGICLVRYSLTLMELVNPEGRMKRDMINSGNRLPDCDLMIHDIEAGIRHLHSLGLVHNDINPSNIMFNGDIPVIIDFDSCRPIGTSLENVGRTYEWYNEDVQLSEPSNDLDALEEIRQWLKNSPVKEFKFDL